MQGKPGPTGEPGEKGRQGDTVSCNWYCALDVIHVMSQGREGPPGPKGDKGLVGLQVHIMANPIHVKTNISLNIGT